MTRQYQQLILPPKKLIGICFVWYVLSLSLQLGLTITMFHSFQELYCIGTTSRWKLASLTLKLFNQPVCNI